MTSITGCWASKGKIYLQSEDTFGNYKVSATKAIDMQTICQARDPAAVLAYEITDALGVNKREDTHAN